MLCKTSLEEREARTSRAAPAAQKLSCDAQTHLATAAGAILNAVAKLAPPHLRSTDTAP